MEPVHYPWVPDILPCLTSGGYSAVIDISKQFYHFPTHPKDQPYLGLIHPITGKYLWYSRLPMGSVSSPGIAGNKMAAVKVELCKHPLVQGR
eukprot:14767221-Ditylum_brightwellii.AAC.1